MRVLVVGAAGTLGRPTVRALVGARHDVIGLTRDASRVSEVERLGAAAVVGDVLDRRSLDVALGETAPEAVLALLSARPAKGLTRLREFGPTLRLWAEGSRHLLDAAAAAGVRRAVAESTIFAYGYGDRGRAPLDETAPAVGGAVLRGHRRVLRALREMERRFLDAHATHGLGGVVVRAGLLYGAGVPSTDHLRRALERRRLRLPAAGESLLSWVEGADAAAARVEALERGRAGEAYNVADDHPRTFGDFAGELAGQIGAEPPGALPFALARALRPHAAVYAGRTRVTVASAKARRELGWRPRHASIEDGIAAYVAAAGARPGR